MPPLPWPYQALAAEDLYRAAIAHDEPDWAPLLAGQGLGLARKESSAAEIVATIETDAARILEQLANQTFGHEAL